MGITGREKSSYARVINRPVSGIEDSSALEYDVHSIWPAASGVTIRVEHQSSELRVRGSNPSGGILFYLKTSQTSGVFFVALRSSYTALPVSIQREDR